MKAIRAHQTGGPENLILEDIDTPTPGKNQVLVRVKAAGVNYIDVYHRTGLYPTARPVPLGLEGAGEVEAQGPGVPPELAPGTCVAWVSIPGSYATHVVVPADRLVPVPEGVSAMTAAAIMLQGMTAHYLTRATFALAPGHTCLVHAAAGGVGLLLCQMARRAGARVIGTVSTEAKADAARAHGADEVILYTEADFVKEVRRITQGAGVHVVYDSVGKSTFEGSLDCLAPRGMLALFGQSSGPVPPLDVQLLAQKGSLFLTRPSLFDYMATRDELLLRAGEVLGWVAAGELKPLIDRSLPLDQAAQAHHLLEGRKTMGKLLLVP